MTDINQKFCLRINKKGQAPSLLFVFNQRTAADAIYKAITVAMNNGYDGKNPMVSFSDDYDHQCTQDATTIDNVVVVGLADAANSQNELSVAAYKGQMHLNRLVEKDNELKAFILASQGRGSIVAPQPGANGALHVGR